MLRNDVISRVGGEGRGWDGIWVSRVNHSPRTSTAYIYLYAFVFVTLAFGRIAARISQREGRLFLHQDSQFRDRDTRISSRGERNSFIRLSYLPGRIISLLSIRGSRYCKHPKCWKHRDLCIIATPVSRSNQPILNSPKGRKKERKKEEERNSTRIVGRGTIWRANRGRKAPGSRELFAARLSGHREERRSRGKYGSRRWSIEQHRACYIIRRLACIGPPVCLRNRRGIHSTECFMPIV